MNAMYEVFIEGRVDFSNVYNSNKLVSWMEDKSLIYSGELDIENDRSLILDVQEYIQSYGINSYSMMDATLKEMILSLFNNLNHIDMNNPTIEYDIDNHSSSIYDEDENSVYKLDINLNGTNQYYITLMLMLYMSNMTELDVVTIHLQGNLIATIHTVEQYRNVLDMMIKHHLGLDTLMINLAKA